MRTFFFPVLTRRQVSESGMRLRSSAGMTFSHTGFGTMPNMAPPSSLKNPSLTACSSKSPSLCMIASVGLRDARALLRKLALPQFPGEPRATDERRLAERKDNERHRHAVGEPIGVKPDAELVDAE